MQIIRVQIPAITYDDTGDGPITLWLQLPPAEGIFEYIEYFL